MNAYSSVVGAIGRTPLVRLANIEREFGLRARLYAKLEARNPGGSAKDRVALQMIETFEREGRLKEGSVIVEPTSGNTGIGLCMIAAARGYRCIIVMPASMSEERKKLMKAFGAQLVLTDAQKGMAGAIEEAEKIVAATPGAVMAGQFENPANPQAHYLTTGPEIWQDTDGEIDAFVAGVGTGGTITGVGKYLKENKPEVCIVGIEPDSSAVLSGERSGAHGLQGIGAGFVPKVLDVQIIDRIVRVKDEDAMTTGRLLARREGVLAGISSGAAAWAAIELAKEEAFVGKNIVVLLPDTGDRYLSTAEFDD
ncbi:MAG: cysteine synthase A [Eubacteriales bacterium]|nr:cysteine synthase A [Eubacteriales bacterium]